MEYPGARAVWGPGGDRDMALARLNPRAVLAADRVLGEPAVLVKVPVQDLAFWLRRRDVLSAGDGGRRWVEVVFEDGQRAPMVDLAAGEVVGELPILPRLGLWVEGAFKPGRRSAWR